MSTQPRRKTVAGVGELLWDLLPDGKQLGGATTNFAYHAHALGAEAWVVSRVGKDRLGREILERFQVLGLPAELVTVDPLALTGTVSVELSADGQPRFTIHENVAWDNLLATRAAHEAAILNSGLIAAAYQAAGKALFPCMGRVSGPQAATGAPFGGTAPTREH